MMRELTVHPALDAVTAIVPGGAIGGVARRPPAHIHRDGAELAIVAGAPSWRDPDMRERASRAGDASVFAQQVRLHGAQAVRALTDGFAVAWADTASRRMLLATDRIGTIPLHHSLDDGRLVFGTDVRAVAAGRRASPSLDLQATHDYFTFSFVPSPATIIRGIHALGPAEILWHEDGESRHIRYWRPDFLESATGSSATYEELRDVLARSVARCVAAGGDGTFLSGGIDSTTILGLMTRETGGPVRAYSLGYADAATSELPYARLSARTFGADHRECILTGASLAGAIQDVAASFGAPTGNVAAPALLTVAGTASADGVAVMVGGDGGDELFAGNESYGLQATLGRWDRLPLAVRRAVAAMVRATPESIPLARRARGYVRRASVQLPDRLLNWTAMFETEAEALFSPALLDAVDRNGPLAILRDAYAEVDSAAPLNRHLAVDWRFILHGSDLPRVRGACMLAGQEALFPMLADDVVALSTRIPVAQKMTTELRAFYKAAFRELLPSETVRKKKQGEGIPLAHWMATDSTLQQLMGDLLTSFRRRGVVRPAVIDELLDRPLFARSRFPVQLVYYMTTLEGWISRHVDRRSV
jgi:asparagine synthase (glutamine-hydrolysing)